MIAEAPFIIPRGFRDMAVAGLGDVWLHPRDGRMLRSYLRRQGCQTVKVLKAEFQRCQICSRPLLGMEATNRRILLTQSPAGELIPCSPRCHADLEMALWTKLMEAA